MKIIIAKKIEMSQRFKEDGTVVPVTLLKAEPCKVMQVKTSANDGYEAIQIGCGEERHPNKPAVGHAKPVGAAPQELNEFRVEAGACKVGDVIDVSEFEPGDFVEVMGTSKGKGFQGVVKRHHFAGGPATRGHKDNLRMPGAIGSGGMQRVFKGLRMGGRMGGEQVTVKNLEVVEVDKTNSILAIKGAVPGARGAVIVIYGSKEKKSWK